MNKVDSENPCLMKIKLTEIFDQIKIYYAEGVKVIFCVFSL